MFGKFNLFRQLKLNKVDFNEVLNALESAQLSVNSLQLVACFGILDLGRWTNTNTKNIRWCERLFCDRLSRLCPALENLELYYCTSGSATASSPVRLPHLTSVTIYRLEKCCRFGIQECDNFCTMDQWQQVSFWDILKHVFNEYLRKHQVECSSGPWHSWIQSAAPTGSCLLIIFPKRIDL